MYFKFYIDEIIWKYSFLKRITFENRLYKINLLNIILAGKNEHNACISLSSFWSEQAINSSLEGLTLLHSERGKNTMVRRLLELLEEILENKHSLFSWCQHFANYEFIFHFWIRRRANCEELLEYPTLFIVLDI